MACTDFGNLQDIGKKYIFTAMVETFDSKSGSISVMGFGPVERAREMRAYNDAAFAAACKTLVMGAGVLSAGIILGNAIDYLVRSKQERRNQNPQ